MALVPRLEMDTVQTKMALGSRPGVLAGTLFSTVLSSLDPRWKRDRGELGRNNCILRQREMAFAFLPLFKKGPFTFHPRFWRGTRFPILFPFSFAFETRAGLFRSSFSLSRYIVWQSVSTMAPKTMLGAAGKVLSFKAPERGQLFNFLSEFSRETNQKLRHGREFGTRRPLPFPRYCVLLCTREMRRNTFVSGNKNIVILA